MLKLALLLDYFGYQTAEYENQPQIEHATFKRECHPLLDEADYNEYKTQYQERTAYLLFHYGCYPFISFTGKSFLRIEFWYLNYEV